MEGDEQLEMWGELFQVNLMKITLVLNLVKHAISPTELSHCQKVTYTSNDNHNQSNHNKDKHNHDNQDKENHNNDDLPK